MKAIRIEEIPWDEKVFEPALEMVGIDGILDEGVCEHSNYTYVGQMDKYMYFCWPPEFNLTGTTLADWLKDLHSALTCGNDPWCKDLSIEKLQDLVVEVEIQDYWK